MAAPVQRPKTVLIIEDDAVFREGLAVILGREGYRVLQAEDGREALDRLHEESHLDLIILDMMLPIEDGWRLMERRRRNPAVATVPVLIVTALGVGSAEWALSLGASGYLRKPVEIADLLAAVRRCCGPGAVSGPQPNR